MRRGLSVSQSLFSMEIVMNGEWLLFVYCQKWFYRDCCIWTWTLAPMCLNVAKTRMIWLWMIEIHWQYLMVTRTESFVQPKIDFVRFQTCSMFNSRLIGLKWFGIALCTVRTFFFKQNTFFFFFYQSVGHISRCISWSEATAMFVMCTHWSFLPCFSLHSVFCCCCISCVRLVGAFILFLFIRSFPFAIIVIKVVHKIFVRETLIRFLEKKCTNL